MNCFSQNNGVVLLSPLWTLFFWFPQIPWVQPLIQIGAYIQTNFLGGNIVSIYPLLEACFWTCYLQWRQRCWWQPILQRHRTFTPYLWCCGPSIKDKPGLIIWKHLADSTRRWEHLRDLVYTLLCPSTARLSSTKQPLGNKGIFPIDSSRQTQVSGVESSYESSAVFTGQ